jgi:hypothetical protein
MPAVLLASGDTQVQAQQNGDLVVVTVPSLQRLGVTLRPAAAPPSPLPGDRYARSDSFSSGPRRRRSPSFRRSPPARRSRSPSRPPVSLVRRSRSPPPPARPTSRSLLLPPPRLRPAGAALSHARGVTAPSLTARFCTEKGVRKKNRCCDPPCQRSGSGSRRGDHF